MAIVSMEDVHLGDPPEGVSGTVDVSASGRSGNTDKSDATVGVRLQWQHAPATDVVIMRYAYGRSRDRTDTNQSFVHLRHIQEWTPRHAGEIFAQAERNEFARLSLRGLLGGGWRQRWIQNPERGAIFTGVGAFYEHETIRRDLDLGDSGTDSTWRGNLYLIFKYQFNARVAAVNSLYYQPSLRETSDYRALEIAGLNVELSERLAISLHLEVSHDSRPPLGVDKTDSRYRTALSYTF